MFEGILLCAGATAVATITITKSSIFAPLRNSKIMYDVDGHPNLFHKLLSCPYCLSHWVALFFNVIFWRHNLNWSLIGVFATVAFSTPIMALISWSMFQVSVYSGGEEEKE